MDTGKENYNPVKNEELLKKINEIKEGFEKPIKFIRSFTNGEFIVIPIPRELLLEIGIPEDKNGCIADVPLQFTVADKKLIIELVTDRDFECDGDCESCPFYEIDCDGDCENCPCSEGCEESEVFE